MSELNSIQESLVKVWSADDRLWTTQETVEFNLRVFARNILKVEECLPLNDVEVIGEPLFGWAKSEAVTIGEILAEHKSRPGKHFLFILSIDKADRFGRVMAVTTNQKDK